jgi:hypothetical protein
MAVSRRAVVIEKGTKGNAAPREAGRRLKVDAFGVSPNPD